MATRSPSWWIKIRLADIDAPESRQAFGARSKQALSDLCFQQEARLETQGRDRYGRTIAAVYWACAGRADAVSVATPTAVAASKSFLLVPT